MDNIVDIVWDRIEKGEVRGRTVTLKLKYNDFQIASRARSLGHFVTDKAEFARTGHALLAEMMPLPRPIRLMGLTLSKLEGVAAKKRASAISRLSMRGVPSTRARNTMTSLVAPC